MSPASKLCLKAAKVLGLIRNLIAEENYLSATESLRYASDLYDEASKLFHEEDYHASGETAMALRQHCMVQAMQIEMDTTR